MSSELDILKNKLQLVRVLSSLSAQDFLKLSKDLQKLRVISKKGSDILASLDHDNLDSNTTVRYLLHVVGERVKEDNTLCAHFLKALTGFRNVGVVQVGESLVSQAHAISQGPGEESGPVPEMMFLEEDVGELCEVLASVSYKWEELCVSLKLPKAIIEECRNAGNNNLKLYRGLTEWVCGRHKNARYPTLSQLKQALSSPFVGLPDLALEIEKLWKTSSDLEGSHFTNTMSESNKVFNISLEPLDTTVADGKSTLLEVQVSHSEAVSYQWMKEDKPLSDSSSFSGTHSSMLLIRKASQGVQGEYNCQVHLGTVQLSTSPVQVTVTFPPDKQRLLELYSNLKEVPQDSWPLVGPNKYVDILLINKMQNAGPSTVREGIEDVVERSSCSPMEVFSQYVEGALIVLQGRPGSGKTTLTYKITKDWVNGKMLRNADKVFLVSLRKDHSKMELFKSFYHSKAQAYVEQLEECGGKGSCFILDGYDEFSNSLGDQSVIHQLIHKTHLPLAMIILTSRPAATATLHSDTKRVYYYESVGFTKKCFEEFVDCYIFQHTREKKCSETIKSQLKDYLKACSNILNICYLPLNASMICFLFDYLREAKKSPKTETEMYKHFILAIALRKLRIANPKSQLQNLEHLPVSDKVIFKQLCLLAFDMTVENIQIIKLPMSLESLDSSCLRGLLTIDGTIRISGLEDTVVFLHLTLQEYLAACHLASLDEHQQTEMIRLHSGKDHMLTMFKFYCGLVDFQNKLQQFDDIVGSKENTLHSFHCAYETQQESICHRAIEIKHGEIVLDSGVLTPADFSALAYVIKVVSETKLKITFLPCLLYEEFIEGQWEKKEIDYSDVLSSTFVSSINFDNATAGIEYDLRSKISYHNKAQADCVEKKISKIKDRLVFPVYADIKELFQSCSDMLSSDSAAPLAEALRRCGHLDSICLYGNYDSTEAVSIISDTVKNCLNLNKFILWGYLSSSKAEHLINSLQHCKHLQCLSFFGADLENVSGLSTVLSQNHGIKVLAIHRCNLNSDDAIALARGLSYSKLSALSLLYNDIGPKGMKALAGVVVSSDISLHACNIESEGVLYLARSLKKSPSLDILDLSKNKIDSRGIKVLAKRLCFCKTLQLLDLSHNDIGYAGAVALANGLQSCIFLRILELVNCNLSAEGIVALMQQVKFLWLMEFLDFSDNGPISEENMSIISDSIKYLRNLEAMSLYGNNIDSKGAIALAKGIQHCPLFKTIDVSKNSIGSDGVVSLALAMKSCKNHSIKTQFILKFIEGNHTSLHYIDFAHNEIDATCIDSLLELLRSVPLDKLDLSHNNIGTNGCIHFVSELDCHNSMEVNLASNNISHEGMTSITRLLKGKYHLKIILH